jgi:hypothetical protein
MLRLTLCLLLLALPNIAHPQPLRLSPAAAKDILALAESARAESNDSAGAVRAFREAFRAKFPDRFPFDIRRDVQAEAMGVHVYSPTQWYVRQLTDALRQEANLSSIGFRDALTIVFAPNDPKRSGPKTLWIQQVEAGHADEAEEWVRAKAITPFLAERMLMEFEDLGGVRVTLPARVFHFHADEIDMTKVTHFNGTADDKDQWRTLVGISASVMKSIR